MLALYHYIFSAEFTTTYIALKSTIEGLAIACSSFTRSKSEGNPYFQIAEEQKDIILQDTISIEELMEDHKKKDKRRKKTLKIFHLGNICLFTVLCMTGFVYDIVAIVAFISMIFGSMCVYMYGLIGIKSLVKRF